MWKCLANYEYLFGDAQRFHICMVASNRDDARLRGGSMIRLASRSRTAPRSEKKKNKSSVSFEVQSGRREGAKTPSPFLTMRAFPVMTTFLSSHL